MSLKLVFLGRLEDAAGAPELAVDAAPSLAQVLARLDPELAAALEGARVKLAVNGVLVQDRDGLVLADGDELAFLPPVSGG
ncbi:MoaD/ThiS family protein [Novosphingobium sp. 9U]|uniref:MoaD/ThiS family protein n=1 Tax=Novosphingobium sp. 9U TaxID=2653158 RepID=UPI0012F361CA|nr:MoaD/ThiS family protein [Novosphingobium sp. 9U]VWX48608.1 Thiamine biosynthesis protein ThiS [Novosphingobium sp. 9U]